MKTFFFDLDYTLLEMNQDEFLGAYYKSIAEYSYKLGYNPKEFLEVFYKAAYAIILNDGAMSNEDRFWSVVEKKYKEIDSLKEAFYSYYRNEFQNLKSYIHKTNYPLEIITYLKNKGYKVILATNPVFPKVATEERIKWAGLIYDMFDDDTTYENCYFCKPNHLYYEEIIKKHNLNPQDCIMVGNDVDDDFSDLPSGIKGYLINDYLINRKDIILPVESFKINEFYEFIKENY
jgi:FMN phosphatase YigB (HAD superfamily)